MSTPVMALKQRDVFDGNIRSRGFCCIGSSLTIQSTEDIDLAVESLEPSVFFSVYSDLLFSLSKLGGLLDLSRKSRFSKMVSRVCADHLKSQQFQMWHQTA